METRGGLASRNSPRLPAARPWPAPRRAPAQVQMSPAEFFARAQIGRRGVLQRMKDPEEAGTRADEFNELSKEEKSLIWKLNRVLEQLSRDLDPVGQKTAFELSTKAKQRTKEISLRHAEIVKEYEAAGLDIRKAFMQALFPKLPKNFGRGDYEPEIEDKPTYDLEWVQSLFDRLIAQTIPNRPKKVKEEEEEDHLKLEEEIPDTSEDVYRYRYLAYSLQSLGDEVGVNQIRHLVHLLGDDRKLVIAEGASYDMSAGPVNIEDKEKGTKLDLGGKDDDEDLLKGVGGNLLLFLQKKFSDFGRKPNPEASKIGDVQVNLDKDNKLFPIFPGIANEHVFLFTTPKFASVHHENGHIISLLEGKAALGKEHKYKEALASLTDQEEAFNIFGGRRSDRAYLQFSQLPIRFNHKTLIQCLENASSWEDWVGLVKESWQKTYKDSSGALTVLQTGVVKYLDRIVDADWDKHTKKVSTPAGVKAIKKEMGKAKTPSAKVTAAQQSAALSAGADSKNRAKVTQEFYDLVGGLDPNNVDSLEAALPKLVVFFESL